MLFPIRIDNFLFNWDHYLKPYLVENAVGDFRGWENQTKYNKALKRLVKALKKGTENLSMF